MHRRTLLTSLGTGGTLSIAGCFGQRDDGLTLSCLPPKLETELAYESRTPSGAPLGLNEGVVLATSPEAVARFDADRLDPADEQWIRETPFETHVVVGIQVGSSSQSSSLWFLGVEHEADPERLIVHSCIADKGQTDDWVPYSRLLRVEYDGTPIQVEYVHREGGETETYTTARRA